MSPERRERALAEVVREAGMEPLPYVDFDAIEARLPMTRVHSVPPRPVNLRPWLMAAVVVLGAGGLGLALARPFGTASAVRSGPNVTEPVPAAVRDLNGDQLALGEHVRSGDRPQSVVHAGHARWTLAPHSEATLLAKGELVTVRLDHGSVTSRVVKSSKTETFAVEAADVRIAAHGTEFVVILGADGVSVSVTEGSVLVGPREEPGTGELLISPSAGRFSFGGQPLAEASHPDALGSLRPGGATYASRASEAPTAANGQGAATSAVEAPLKRPLPRKVEAAEEHVEEVTLAPDQPTPEGLELATRAVQQLTQRCFRDRTIAGEGVRVTAQSTVTFRTLPAGSVSKVVFEPPLSPAVQACVSAGVGGIVSEGTRHGFQVSRVVDLER
jgi:hypothetical protein